ncbi:MAG: family 78 glycoside hydrolase catalytic domain [Clostridia bacterium]|nr:family 78 glycoside hydrolase catalytic domain [Clostridia bacterium]
MHSFQGQWITDEEFCALEPRNVFHRQLVKVSIPCEEHRNRHILFRKSFHLNDTPREATVYITADDYYKLYINGEFVAQGPAPAYHFQYPYNTVDVTAYLRPGKNVIAVHTLYQGLINRVWQSGDLRHGLLMDLVVDGEVVACSDSTFRTHPHTAYREVGTVGYRTQFLEEYDSRSAEVGFDAPDYDDSHWSNASPRQVVDYTVLPQKSDMLTFERILPVQTEGREGSLRFDFGSIYVGYLRVKVKGRRDEVLTVRCAQELEEDGALRVELRANCHYEEPWILDDGESVLDWFDYKSFRYAELLLPADCEVTEVCLLARHYPFSLAAKLKPEYASSPALRRVWELCVNSQRYGVQEVIQDCMEREKGFYMGDGCYTALAHMILTGDDSMVRKLIEDGFSSSFITDGLVTCLDCSFMQEIAEFPLMLIYLVLWHHRLTGDLAFLREQYPKVTALLEVYRREYEQADGLLNHLDKWCVVEWPKNFQDGYDADIKEGKVCTTAHISINAYYLEAIHTANVMAELLGQEPYREEAPLRKKFQTAFYLPERDLFRDAVDSEHTSLVGNSFAFAFGLYEEKGFQENFLQLLRERGIHSLSLFCTFPVLMGLVRIGEWELLKEQLLNEGAWLRILREGGTTTFEGWGRDTKWNTSLFHLTMSYAAVFLADIDQKTLFQ